MEHALILGHPGSGKTARLGALVAQLIRSRSCSVVLASLKPEPYLFQGVREECFYSNLRFRWLTNYIGLPSYAFNPLVQSYLPWRSMNQRVEPLLRALGLNYGESYGGSWFASNMQTFLNNLMTYYTTSIYSFLDLARLCADPNLYCNAEKRLGTKEDWSNSRHVHNDFFRLAGVEPLNVTKDSKQYPPAVFENAIDAAQLFAEPQCVYLHLSSIGEDTTSRNIVKLFLYSLLNVAEMLSTVRHKHGVTVGSVPVFFVVDEFEELVSNTFLPALAQARSLSLGCILCLQALSQLNLGDRDLTNNFLATTTYKHILSAADLFTSDYIVRSGGETEEAKVRWSQTIPKHSRSVPQGLLGTEHALPEYPLFTDPEVQVEYVKRPRLTMNDVMELSSDPYSSMANLVADKEGTTRHGGRWFPVWSGYHIDRDTFERRESEPFPSGDEGTLLVGPYSEYSQRY